MTDHTAAPPVPVEDRWTAVLDELAADLDALELALAEDAALPSTAWAPPTGLGPLPEPLRPRAAELLERVGAVQLRVEDARDDLGAQVEDVAVRRTAAAAYERSAGELPTA